MVIRTDPLDYVSETKTTTCSFHQANPLDKYAGCTCTVSWSYRKATPEERKVNIKRKDELRKRFTGIV